MNRREAFELVGKVTAVLLVAVVAATLLIVALKEAAPQPHLPLVDTKGTA